MARVLSLPSLAGLINACKRYGLVGTGAVDNTARFAAMCSTPGQALLLPPGDYVTGAFSLPNNTLLVLAPGAIIRDSGALGASDRFVNIVGVSGVTIIGHGAQVVMNRADYTSGEQRHGVFVFGSDDVRIEGLASDDSGGDGFYVGGDEGDHPARVFLVGCSADNNRRQGLSITQGEHVRVISSRFTNTTGTNPQNGVDIEPNTAGAILKDIVLRDVYTENNDGAGVQVHLIQLDATSQPVSIDIYGHRDVGSDLCAHVSAALNGTKGYVRWHAPVWKEAGNIAFAALDWEKDGVLCEVFDPKVIDSNRNASVSEAFGAAFYITRESGSVTGSDTIGGVHIYRPDIRVTDATLPTVAFYVHNAVTPNDVDDVRIIDPVNVEYSAAPTRFAAGSIYVRDSNGVLTNSVALSQTIDGNRFYSKQDNTGAAGAITWDLDDLLIDGKEWSFEVATAQNLTVRVDQDNAANRIFPGSYTSLQCNEVGGRITLKKGAGGWWVTNQVGVWHTGKFAISNLTTDHTLNADSVAVAELADIVGTLIQDLRRNP